MASVTPHQSMAFFILGHMYDIWEMSKNDIKLKFLFKLS